MIVQVLMGYLVTRRSLALLAICVRILEFVSCGGEHARTSYDGDGTWGELEIKTP